MPPPPALAAVLTMLLAAAPVGPEDAPCADKTSVRDIAACLEADAAAWDRRLNAAYAGLRSRLDPGQAEPLRAAQRLWVQFRDANCRFYGAQDGTIRAIGAAECLRAATRDRTLELERAMKPE